MSTSSSSSSPSSLSSFSLSSQSSQSSRSSKSTLSYSSRSTSSSSSSSLDSSSSSSSSSIDSSSSSSRSSKSSLSSKSTSSSSSVSSSSYSSSSSSSSSLDSSSSSSSSSLDSSSSSSSSFSSSSNSSSSSSTEVMPTSSSSSSSYVEEWSSSSSSSSRLDNHWNRTIPFQVEVEDVNPVWVLAEYNGDIFAGTGTSGILLRSSDRSFWSEVCSVDDNNIRSLIVENDDLFIGTGPQGKIYIFNITSNSLSLSQEMDGEVYSFCYYKNEMYAAAGNPTEIYKYDNVADKWDAIYRLPGKVVSKMLIFDEKMYVFFSDFPNFISFDGESWILEVKGMDNISSLRYVSQSPSVYGNFVDRESIRSASYPTVTSDEIIDGIFPIRDAVGIGGADGDGSSLIVGTSKYSRVYNYFEARFYEVFDTQADNTVHYLLNLSDGVNLASVDNKVYLLYNSNASSTTTTTTEMVTTTTTTEPRIVQITFPAGGESFILGDTVTITWTSTRSLNDAVSLNLYQNTTLITTINARTSNNGSYEWDIPTTIASGSNYRIVIEWLSAGDSTAAEIGVSGEFNILYPNFTTTTTTTTQISNYVSEAPDFENVISIPILNLDNEYVTCMIKDESNGGVLFSTSKGRILGCRESTMNAYLTGDRKIYAEVSDGFGNASDSAYMTMFYSLYNKIAEINENKEIEKWKFSYDPSAIPNDRITGIFISPAIYIKNDLVSWRQLMWSENKPDNTEIIICVRASNDLNVLTLLPWNYCFTSRDSDRGYGSSGLIVRNLNDFQINGKYLQFKVTLITDEINVAPTLINLTLSYSSKFSVYFFTTKFSLSSQADVKSGVLVAEVTEPQNTEVLFGISDTNSNDWNDYTEVELNKLFSLDSYDKMKVGIRMVSYDIEYPQVAEFALMSGSSVVTEINNV